MGPKRHAHPRGPRSTATDGPKPARVPPLADPAEAVERLVSRRQLILEAGDVVLTRELAGPMRTSLGTTWRYQLGVHLEGPLAASGATYARYELGVMNGEELAAKRRVRLFYDEGGALTLLKDYRPK